MQPHLCAACIWDLLPARVLCADVTHTNGMGQSAAFQLVLFPLPSLHNADVAWGPFVPGAAFCMDKAGWSTCLCCWTEMRGVVSKRQKKREKNSLFSQFLIVLLLLWWWWLLMSVCLEILLSRACFTLCACAVLETAAMLCNHNSNESGMKCKALICYVSSKSVTMQKSPLNACAERHVWTW